MRLLSKVPRSVVWVSLMESKSRAAMRSLVWFRPLSVRPMSWLALARIVVFASARQPSPKVYHFSKAAAAFQAEFLLQQTKEEEEVKEEETSFKLPASLQFIDEEAFEGTAVKSIQLPESVTSVGDRAFADNDELLEVYFPVNLQQIGRQVLDGSDRAVMAVFAESDALFRAVEEGNRFRLMSAFGPKRTKTEFAITTGLHSIIKGTKQIRSSCFAEIKEKRTGRTTAELKEEKYGGVAALYIQSRYFP